ncbi:MAG: CbiM family transporter [Gemmataceae bacterium]
MFLAIGTPYSALLAIHLPDNVIAGSWCLGGFALAALLMWYGAWRIRDEEIPRVAILASAFFVASQIHVRLPVTSAHLLLNGLLGVILGRRALLAIPVGLFMQMALFSHGGWTTLGLNACIMGLPALLACLVFEGIRRTPLLTRSWFRFVLIALCTLVFFLSLIYSVTILMTNQLNHAGEPDLSGANAVTFHPGTLLFIFAAAGAAAWLERRLDHGPEFALGLLVGEMTVLATVAINSLVLVLGGIEDFGSLPLFILVLHLPLAVIEGIILGFTVSFLARVKPEMLGWQALEADRITKND